MRYKNDKQYQICHHQIRLFQAQNAPKSVFGRGSAPDPAGRAYDAPPDLLVGWGGVFPPRSPPHSTPSASTASRFSGPSTQNPG